jgi:hypothetical protein
MHDVAVANAEDEVVDAMAQLARRTGLVVHVIVPRTSGVVTHARRVAAQDGLRVEADLRPNTVSLRFGSD